MKIAILSTPTIALPPIGYGGTERVIYNLSEGLHKKHHEVAVFATGDSKISSNLYYYYNEAIGSSYKLTYNVYYTLNHIYYFLKWLRNKSFDIVHFNDAGRFSLYFADYLRFPFVTTLHGSYFPIKDDLYNMREEKIKQLYLFKDYPYISISFAQRQAISSLNYVGNIYNSVILSEFSFNESGGDYISWLGRVDKVKGLDEAILVANLIKKSLISYGHVNDGSIEYFDKVIKPLIKDKILFKGNLYDANIKSSFLGRAKLFLFPLKWEEPFGITMIESMACGTPVVAFARGSVPEVVKDGKTGFTVNSSEEDKRGEWIVKKTGIEGLCEAVERIYSMPEDEYRQMRKNCRKHVEENFTVEKMVSGYEEVYKKVINRQVTR